MKLLLIRHGDPNYESDGLTETGTQEALALAERIAPLAVRDYYVSPMGRARATAAPTLERAGREAEVCGWLREFDVPVRRPDRADSPIPWDWLPQDWTKETRFFSHDQWREVPAFREAGVGEAYDRVTEAFDALLARHGYVREGGLYRVTAPNEDRLVFFCHLGLSCVLLSHLLNCSPMVLWHGLAMAPSSVTTLNSEERRPGFAQFRAAAIGDISHLYVKGREPSFAARFCETYGNGDRVD